MESYQLESSIYDTNYHNSKSNYHADTISSKQRSEYGRTRGPIKIFNPDTSIQSRVYERHRDQMSRIIDLTNELNDRIIDTINGNKYPSSNAVDAANAVIDNSLTAVNNDDLEMSLQQLGLSDDEIAIQYRLIEEHEKSKLFTDTLGRHDDVSSDINSFSYQTRDNPVSRESSNKPIPSDIDEIDPDVALAIQYSLRDVPDITSEPKTDMNPVIRDRKNSSRTSDSRKYDSKSGHSNSYLPLRSSSSTQNGSVGSSRSTNSSSSMNRHNTTRSAIPNDRFKPSDQRLSTQPVNRKYNQYPSSLVRTSESLHVSGNKIESRMKEIEEQHKLDDQRQRESQRKREDQLKRDEEYAKKLLDDLADTSTYESNVKHNDDDDIDVLFNNLVALQHESVYETFEQNNPAFRISNPDNNSHGMRNSRDIALANRPNRVAASSPDVYDVYDEDDEELAKAIEASLNYV